MVGIKVDCRSDLGDRFKVLFPSGLEEACNKQDLLGIFTEDWANRLRIELVKLKVLVGDDDALDGKGLAEEDSLLDTVSEAPGDLDQDPISLVTGERGSRLVIKERTDNNQLEEKRVQVGVVGVWSNVDVVDDRGRSGGSVLEELDEVVGADLSKNRDATIGQSCSVGCLEGESRLA